MAAASEDLGQQPAGQTAPGDPGRRRWAVLAVVGIALFMGSVDQTIVATALSSIGRDLDATLTWTGWTLTASALGLVAALPLAGRLGDRFGRRRLFLAAVALFTLASLACALAPNIYVLAACRFVQSLGSGAFLPSATGIVAEQFGPDRDRAIGLFSSIFPIGMMSGPVIGGVLVGYASWEWCFLVNVPIGILLLGLGILVIRDVPGRSTAPIDKVGIGLIMALLLALMTGFTVLGEPDSRGVADARFLIAEGVALLAGVVLWRHLQRTASPVIPLELVRGRGFAESGVINFVFGSASNGVGVLLPLYATLRYGLSPIEAGTMLTLRALGMASTAGLAAFAMRRLGVRRLMASGFGIMAGGMVMMALPPPTAVSTVIWLNVAAAVVGAGMGVAVPPTNNAVMHLAPESAATLSGLRSMFRNVGAILAVSTMTALLARSADPGLVQAVAFVVFAALLFPGTLPLVFRLSEHRGRW